MVALFCTVQTLSAQEYKSAIGAKLGYGLVGSYKTFLNEKAALDIFAGIGWGNSFLGGVYYQHHMPIGSVPGLQWFVGGGVSFWSFSSGVGFGGYYELGIAGDIGLDYAFENIPLNLSVDYAPTFVILDSYDCPGCTYSRFRGGYGALTARYILKR
jgi:hypothetical protein